ncbi:hypothetical protein SAY87_026762 [Trapa incisa]|uniref:Glycosyltransferase n=1 Tax=Trapa incisa TaxID=236973 RepID=A0AAN7GYC2_9MYRT|nr:hypothetical protein SAY87_026762 [Trapa incisa]
MASPNPPSLRPWTWEDLHFVLIPLMCPGHLIPMVDIACLIAQHRVLVTVATTPANTARVQATVIRATALGLPIRILEVEFPAKQAGLPEGCENVDALPSMALVRNFMAATEMLRLPIERRIREDAATPPPSCIVSDRNLAWTADLADDLDIPRVVFDGMSCFTHLCMHNLQLHKPHEKGAGRSELFTVPEMPRRVDFTVAQLPGNFNPPSNIDIQDIRERTRESAERAHAVIINSFDELELEYIAAYRKVVRGGRAWCVGPVSLCNKTAVGMRQRGNSCTAADETAGLIAWLDSHKPGSVIYACLGSLNRVGPAQMMEMGRGLESSRSPFVWVIRGANRGEELDRWLSEDQFEERNRGRGLVVRGWAPQVLILSYPSIGGFLTHCGWNSTLEGVAAGVPMVTWPLFAEQFFNEKVVVEVLGVGVGVGAEEVIHLGEEDKYGVTVRAEAIRDAVVKVMSGGGEGAERRRRARELAKMAAEATEEGGSSAVNMRTLIDYIKEQRGARTSRRIK